MYRSIFVFALFCSLIGCQNPEKSVAARGSAGPESTVTMRVNGMSCPLCAHNIKQQLVKQPGVNDVSINLGKGLVIVSVDGKAKVTRDAYVKAISDSGFTVVDLNDDGDMIRFTCTSCSCENCRCSVAKKDCDPACRCHSS